MTLNAYELVLVFDANLGVDKIEALLAKIEGKIKSLDGEVEKVDKWGARRVASKIRKAKKLTQIYYTIIFFKSPTNTPNELKKYLKVTENIIRYEVVKAVPKEEKLGDNNGGPAQAVNVGEIGPLEQ